MPAAGWCPLPQVARQTGIFQSSSPSYLLMASIDSRLRLLEDQGEALCAAWARRLAEFDRQIQSLRHLPAPATGRRGEAIPGVFAWDPTKILISTRDSALTGVELKDRLRADYRIEVEMALDHYVVAMTGLGTDDTMPTRLASALLALDRQYGPLPEDAPPPVQRHALPPRRCSVEEAAMAQGASPSSTTPWGRCPGEYLWAYPPASPLVTPGRRSPWTWWRRWSSSTRRGSASSAPGASPPITIFALGDQDG